MAAGKTLVLLVMSVNAVVLYKNGFREPKRCLLRLNQLIIQQRNHVRGDRAQAARARDLALRRDVRKRPPRWLSTPLFVLPGIFGYTMIAKDWWDGMLRNLENKSEKLADTSGEMLIVALTGHANE